MRQSWINLQAETLRRAPPRVRAALSVARHLPTFLEWSVHPQGRKRLTNRVAEMRGRYEGYRCIVIGNGPSLKLMDLEPLRREYTFGLNRIYLLADQLGFHMTFYAAIARYVLEQFTSDIQAIQSLKFLNWSYRKPYIDTPEAVFVETGPSLAPSGNILRGYYAGAGTVTNFALQIAYFMGFSEVILIGVDHHYDTSGTPNRAIIASGPDRNHFAQDYFGPGIVWQLPDMQAMEDGYRMLRRLYEKHSRRIVDATDGGMLTVFPKVDFRTYLSESPFRSMGNDAAT